jgi:hypothetical protein
VVSEICVPAGGRAQWWAIPVQRAACDSATDRVRLSNLLGATGKLTKYLPGKTASAVLLWIVAPLSGDGFPHSLSAPSHSIP